ncbi:MAG: imidazole glycerol phosphate synthase subunit HisF [Candidatus Omnitrophica bacterium]|nr:imidazole glycerol phosphate synthase subunit HisF [Candidatus Omnitrophota bacterium]
MLTKRIIVCMDVKKGRIVKGVHFVNLRDAGDPVKNASIYSRAGADEIVFLDITASIEKRRTIFEIVKKTAEKVFIPLTVGGGIRKLEDIRELLKSGADKVSINTAAIERPELVQEASERFGSQCIVAAIDARQKKLDSPIKSGNDQKWEVYSYGGRKATGLDAVKWAKKVEKLGAGNMKHLYDALTRGKASAVLVASIFHYGKYSVPQVKRYLKNKGIAIRLV